MPLSKEQIEIERVKFERERIKDCPMHNIDRCDGEYVEMHTWCAFRFWIKAIESIEIDLPEASTRSGGYYKIDAVEYLEAQGFKVKS